MPWARVQLEKAGAEGRDVVKLARPATCRLRRLLDCHASRGEDPPHTVKIPIPQKTPQRLPLPKENVPARETAAVTEESSEWTVKRVLDAIQRVFSALAALGGGVSLPEPLPPAAITFVLPEPDQFRACLTDIEQLLNRGADPRTVLRKIHEACMEHRHALSPSHDRLREKLDDAELQRNIEALEEWSEYCHEVQQDKDGIESSDPTTRDAKRRAIAKRILDLLNTAIDVASSHK